MYMLIVSHLSVSLAFAFAGLVPQPAHFVVRVVHEVRAPDLYRIKIPVPDFGLNEFDHKFLARPYPYRVEMPRKKKYEFNRLCNKKYTHSPSGPKGLGIRRVQHRF